MAKLEPGAELNNRYVVTAHVGQGSMALVYSAEDRQSGRRVAVKQMGMYVEDPDELQLAVQQFEHEAELLHDLEHPNIPRVYEWFTVGDDHYLVMDFIDGEILSKRADIVPKGDRPPAFLPTPQQVVDWALQITRALQYLHSQKPRPIIYKDLKPDNLMLTSDGRVMLLDFGIAKGRDAQGKYKTILKGMLSPGYGAPEQYSGAATDPRADLYSLGATMYALLTGRVPPQAIARHERLYAHEADPMLPVRAINPSVSPQLEALIVHLTALKRDERTPSADHVLHELELLPENATHVVTSPPPKDKPSVAIAVLLLVLLGAAGYLLWWLFIAPRPAPVAPSKHSHALPGRPRSVSASARSAPDRTAGATRRAPPA